MAQLPPFRTPFPALYPCHSHWPLIAFPTGPPAKLCSQNPPHYTASPASSASQPSHTTSTGGSLPRLALLGLLVPGVRAQYSLAPALCLGGLQVGTLGRNKIVCVVLISDISKVQKASFHTTYSSDACDLQLYCSSSQGIGLQTLKKRHKPLLRRALPPEKARQQSYNYSMSFIFQYLLIKYCATQ